jgi:multidrug efflux pump subunit AcrA (membrane-fusion protein)
MNMRRLRNIVFLRSAAGGLALGALSGCSPEIPEASASTRDRPVAVVEVEPVRAGPLSDPVRVSGLTRSRQTQSLAFKVGGVLSAVLVEPGQRVKRGQVLATVDPAEFSASAAQAKDGLAKADRDLARATALSREGAIPKATLDDAATAASLARESLRVATFNERHTLLVAPAAGVVDRRLVEPGEIVAPGRPVVAFLGTERGWVVDVALSDRQAATLETGQEARVSFDALPDAIVRATSRGSATPRRGRSPPRCSCPRPSPSRCAPASWRGWSSTARSPRARWSRSARSWTESDVKRRSSSSKTASRGDDRSPSAPSPMGSSA